MAGVEEVLERLITDPGFRRRLREDPAAALQGYELSEADLELLATQLDDSGGGTRGVEQRASRSALFGLLAGMGEPSAGASGGANRPYAVGGVWNTDQGPEEGPSHPDYGAAPQQSSLEFLTRLSSEDASSGLAAEVDPEQQPSTPKVQFPWYQAEGDPVAGEGGVADGRAMVTSVHHEGEGDVAQEAAASADGEDGAPYLTYKLTNVVVAGTADGAPPPVEDVAAPADAAEDAIGHGDYGVWRASYGQQASDGSGTPDLLQVTIDGAGGDDVDRPGSSTPEVQEAADVAGHAGGSDTVVGQSGAGHPDGVEDTEQPAS